MTNSSSYEERNSWLSEWIPRTIQQLQLPHMQLASNIQNRPATSLVRPRGSQGAGNTSFRSTDANPRPHSSRHNTKQQRKEPLACISISAPSPSGSVRASSSETLSPFPSLECQPLCRQRKRDEISNQDWCYMDNKHNQADHRYALTLVPQMMNWQTLMVPEPH